jgi:hypothetical protein
MAKTERQNVEQDNILYIAVKTPPWNGCPIATTSSGLISAEGIFPNTSCTVLGDHRGACLAADEDDLVDIAGL